MPIPRTKLSSFQREVEKLLARMIEASHNNPAVERLSDDMQVLVRAYSLPTLEEEWPEGFEALGKVKVTNQQSRILLVLATHFRQTVRKEAILGAITYDYGADKAPDPKGIEVQMVRLRRQIKGSGFRIDTVWGEGYRLVKDTDENIGWARPSVKAA